MPSSSTIRRWLGATSSGVLIPDDGEFRFQARRLWLRVKGVRHSPHLNLEELVPRDEVADFAFAFGDLAEAEVSWSTQELAVLAKVWDWFSAAQWEDNEFDEKSDFLGDLAYVLARGFRHVQAYREMRNWEKKCCTLVGSSEPSRSYLAAFAATDSATAAERVLASPPLLLTFCREQERLRNIDPGRALRNSSRAFGLVSQRISQGAPLAEYGYFAADLAQSAAVAAGHFKYRDSSTAWAQAVEHYLETSPHCSWLLPIAGGVRVMVLFSNGQAPAVLREAGFVAEDLEKLGADSLVVSVKLAEGQILKQVGQYDECVQLLSVVAKQYVGIDEHKLGLVYAHLADARLETGDVEGALRDCQRAYPLLQNAGSPLALPTLQMIVGQLFRVMGRTESAVDALRESASNFADASLRNWAAYSRILSAETLLLAERVPEALDELVTALALLEGSEAEQEVWAAVKLLRAGLEASKPVGSQVQRCRERLAWIRKGPF